MNISHLLLCTSLLAAPVCAAQGLTETETETPASSSRLPAPWHKKLPPETLMACRRNCAPPS
ncbi:hypothetical protein M5E88_00210 [Akkermansia muciniphila]|nr:hypothetical protein M5E88_00210 [Akkermansia muciniphila]